MKKKIYLIGSLRNPKVPELAAKIRELGFEVFDDWFAAGPEADDWWQKYEQSRGRSYPEAMDGYAANHVFNFDKHHLDTSDAAILMLPAGKSGHLELGYMAGRGNPTYILLDETKPVERWDVMYLFAKKLCHNNIQLFQHLLEDLRDHSVKPNIVRTQGGVELEADSKFIQWMRDGRGGDMSTPAPSTEDHQSYSRSQHRQSSKETK